MCLCSILSLTHDPVCILCDVCNLLSLSISSLSSPSLRWTVSQQREQLRIRLPSRSRSPVVQRKTKAIVGEETHLTMNIPPDEAAETVSYTVSDKPEISI